MPGKIDGIDVNLNKFYKDFKELRFFSSFEVNDLPVFMINIYHNKWLTDYLNADKKELVEKYLNQCKRFMQEIALPLIKNWIVSLKYYI